MCCVDLQFLLYGQLVRGFSTASRLTATATVTATVMTGVLCHKDTDIQGWAYSSISWALRGCTSSRATWSTKISVSVVRIFLFARRSVDGLVAHGHGHGQFIWMIKIKDGTSSNLNHEALHNENRSPATCTLYILTRAHTDPCVSLCIHAHTRVYQFMSCCIHTRTYIYINLYVYKYVHTDTHTDTHPHMFHCAHTHTHARTHARTHAHTHTHKHTHTHGHHHSFTGYIHIYMYIPKSTCIYIHVYVYIYTHVVTILYHSFTSNIHTYTYIPKSTCMYTCICV